MNFLRPGTVDELARRFGKDLDVVNLRVSEYMRHSPTVLSTTAIVRDPKRPGETIPQGYRTDGEWIWSDHAAQMVHAGRVAVPVPFAEKVMATGDPPTRLAPDVVEAALSAIYELANGR